MFQKIVLLILLLYSFFPLYICINASLKTLPELFTDPISLPQKPVIENYINAFTKLKIGQAYINSSILAIGTIIGILLTAIPAAYALAKMKTSKISNTIITYFFFCTTIPAQLSIIPLYFTFAKLKLTNSLIPLILIHIAGFSPFSILLMRSYFVKIPDELIEAALVDGASMWQIFWRIIIPNTKPGIITTSIIVGMWSWNSFMLPLTFINKENLMPVTVALAMAQGKWSVHWEMMMAGALLGALPIIILFSFLHRGFIEGLASTGLKG
jgi:raffinose/stachyose/melibiose transport system permease protein